MHQVTSGPKPHRIAFGDTAVTNETLSFYNGRDSIITVFYSGTNPYMLFNGSLSL